ncbi:MAG: flagellar protein FlaG [Anaerolineales bacterium]|nr:flagellar protein FlaG [Anaerolineales bacterium]
MSDEFAVKRVGPTTPDYNFQALQAQQQNQAVAESVKASTTVQETEKQSESKPEEERSKDKPKFNINNVGLQFEVNNDTGDVTVKIIDRDTKEVLRTIPQRDFRDLSVAELFSFST